MKLKRDMPWNSDHYAEKVFKALDDKYLKVKEEGRIISILSERPGMAEDELERRTGVTNVEEVVRRLRDHLASFGLEVVAEPPTEQGGQRVWSLHILKNWKA